MKLYYLMRLNELLRAIKGSDDFRWEVTDNAIIVTVRDYPYVFPLERSENGT